MVPIPLVPPWTSRLSPSRAQAALEHIVPDGEQGLGNGCRDAHVHVARDAQAMRRMREAILGVSPALTSAQTRRPSISGGAPMPVATTVPATSSPGIGDAPGGGG